MALLTQKKMLSDSTVLQMPDTFKPQMTSLVDIMAILIIFLIKNYSVEGTIVTPGTDLVLPVSSAKKAPRLTTSIEITRGAIQSEGTVIAPLSTFEKADSMLIPRLLDWMLVQRNRGSDTAISREVLIQSDREIEFNIVKRVMFTCSKAGFSDFTILVLQES